MRAAICLRGAVAKLGEHYGQSNDLYKEVEYVNYTACYNSIRKHIIEANTAYEFDIYIHCWSVDLKEELDALYAPKRSLYEDNNSFKDEILCKGKTTGGFDYNQASQALSMKRCLELMDNTSYDHVIIYRPDVFLWKDMTLSNYDRSKISVNGHPDRNGDFHFVMSQDNAKRFANLYDSAGNGNACQAHHWIKSYITNHMKVELVMDDISPGKNQEVLRKLNAVCCNHFHIPIETFLQYGLTKDEITSKYNGR